MALARTTRCWVFAVLAVGSLTLRAAAPDPPLALFPVREMWTLPLGSVLAAPPAFDGSSAYVALDDGRLIAYELAQGTPLWTADATPQSRPAVGGGLVFISGTTGLTALDAKSGAVSWHVPLTETLTTPLVWDNGWLIATTSTGSVLAFRARDGQLVWHQELPASATAPAALAADRVYVPAADGRIYAMQVESGKVLWHRQIGGSPGEVAADDTRLYVGSTDNDLYCLLAKDGTVDWRWPTGGDIVGAPVLAEGRVYFVSLDNLLRALDAKSGGQRWKRALTIRPARGPIAAGTVLFTSGNATTASAYRMDTGAPAGDIAADGLFYAAPHYVANNGLPYVVFAARDVARGAVVHAMIRSVEPPTPAIAPLPNPIVPTPPGVSEPTSAPPAPGASR